MSDRAPDDSLADLVEGSPELCRLLLETSIDPIAVLAEDGRLVYVSAGYEQLVGRGAAPRIGSSAVDRLHPDHTPAVGNPGADVRKAAR